MSDEIKEPSVDQQETVEAVENQSNDELDNLGFMFDEPEDEPEEEPSEEGEEDVQEEVPSGTPEELPSLEERLGEFKEFEEVAVEDPDKQALEAIEREIKTLESNLTNIDIFSQLPQDAVFAPNGKSIYAMTESELNDYVSDLNDQGNPYAAGRVTTAYQDALRLANNFIAAQNVLNEKRALAAEKRDFNEWKEVRSEIHSKLPELTDADFALIAKHIEEKAVSDPLYFDAIKTRKGKMEKGVEAMSKLGILKRLKETVQKEPVKQPSAPDAHVASKKVNVKRDVSDLTDRLEKARKMPQKEFNKISQEDLDAMLEASFSA